MTAPAKIELPVATASDIAIVVMAHNEERRIGACLASLPIGADGIDVHVVVNGSSDRTAQIARAFDDVTVHEYAKGGKARSWNHFIFDGPRVEAETFVFVDGDAEVLPGSVAALAASFAENPYANAASGLPRNGRRARYYTRRIAREHGLFGDLYALRGSFVAKLRRENIRLPDDVIGDDSLLCALAKTDARDESYWDDGRVVPCKGAGFLCEPTEFSRSSLTNQYHRMLSYSRRHFQNRIISEIMRNGGGPSALPRHLADLYPQWRTRWRPRIDPVWWWFDRLALRAMRTEL